MAQGSRSSTFTTKGSEAQQSPKLQSRVQGREGGWGLQANEIKNDGTEGAQRETQGNGGLGVRGQRCLRTGRTGKQEKLWCSRESTCLSKPFPKAWITDPHYPEGAPRPQEYSDSAIQPPSCLGATPMPG